MLQAVSCLAIWKHISCKALRCKLWVWVRQEPISSLLKMMRSCPSFNCLQTTQIDNIFKGPTLEPQHSLGWICNCASPILFYYIVWYFMISIIHNVQYNMLFSLVMEFERLLILWTNIGLHFVFCWACYQWIISFYHIIKYRPLWPKLIRLFIHKNHGYYFQIKFC